MKYPKSKLIRDDSTLSKIKSAQKERVKEVYWEVGMFAIYDGEYYEVVDNLGELTFKSIAEVNSWPVRSVSGYQPFPIIDGDAFNSKYGDEYVFCGIVFKNNMYYAEIESCNIRVKNKVVILLEKFMSTEFFTENL